MVKTTVSSLLRFLDSKDRNQHVNEQDSTGKTILHHALSIHGNDIINNNQYFHVLDRLLRLPGLDKNIADHEGKTPLVIAIGNIVDNRNATKKDMDCYFRMLTHLLSHPEVRLNDYYLIPGDHKSPSESSDLPFSKYFGKKITLLMSLAFHWNHPMIPRIIDLLIRAGADPTLRVRTTSSADKMIQEQFRVVNRDLVRHGMAQGRSLKTAKDVMDQQRRLRALGQTQRQQSVTENFKARETVLDIARRFIIGYLTFVFREYAFHRNISKNPFTIDPVAGDPNMVELLFASNISWASFMDAIRAKGLKQEDVTLLGLHDDMYHSIGRAYALRSKQLFLERLKTELDPQPNNPIVVDEQRLQQILKRVDTLTVEKQIKVFGLFLTHLNQVNQNHGHHTLASMNRRFNTMVEGIERIESKPSPRSQQQSSLLDNLVNAILLIKTLMNAKQTYQRSKIVYELDRGLKRKRLSPQQEAPHSSKFVKAAAPCRSPRKIKEPIVKARRQIISGIDQLPPDLHHQLISMLQPHKIKSK